MSVDEINEIIARDLYEDAYERQMKAPKPYRGKRLAEKLENLLFICPECGRVDSLYSAGNQVICKECGLTFTYDVYGMLQNAPFKTVREFAQWQRLAVQDAVQDRVTYQAPHAKMIQVVNHQESLAGEGELILTQDSLICGEKEIPLEQILGMSRHGKRALVLSTVDAYYEILVSEGANALKFLLLYYGYTQRVKAE
jgi:transcription elongation factor Elf1